MLNSLPQPKQTLNNESRPPSQRPILAWFDDRLFLTDPQRQKVLCEFQIRYCHNGRVLACPEIALPEVIEIQRT